jgi:hypothetical protein
MPDTKRLRDWTSANAALLAVATVNVALHLLAINRYGYHRDELYFLDCAAHLDFGFVDHPPLTDFILSITRFLIGDSLVAIRIPAVIASTFQVVLTGLVARELGGDRFSEAFAGLAAVFAPVYLITSGMIAVEGINTFWWAACLYLSVRLVKKPAPGRWLLLGVSFGLGLQAKYAIAFLGVALAIGFVVTPSRRLLAGWWPWLAVALAFVIFLPNLVWQATHGWPFLEYARSIRTHMMDWIPLHVYLLFQLVYLSIPAAPLWIGGLSFLLFAVPMRPFRFLGVAFVALLVILIVTGSKPYYPAPAYAVLFAAGAVGAGRLFGTPGRRWLRAASIGALCAVSIPFLPYSLPVLTVEQFHAYSKVVYVAPAFTFETGRQIELPQYFADMFGWEEQASTVARVFHSLTSEEKARTTIFAENYGEAGAVNLYGPRLGIPRAVSGHFSYFYWGPGPGNPDIVIAFGEIAEEDLRRDFGDVTLAATIRHPHAIFYENGIPVYICRKPRVPLRELWPGTRDFG